MEPNEVEKPSKKQYITSIVLQSIALILVLIITLVLLISFIDLIKTKNSLNPGDNDTTGIGFAAIILLVFYIGGTFAFLVATILNIIACINIRKKKKYKWNAYSIISVILVFTPAVVWGILYGICQLVSKIFNNA